MKWKKKQGMKLAYVRSYGKALRGRDGESGWYRSGAILATEGEPHYRALQKRERARHLRFDPWRPADETRHKSIPLEGDGANTAGEVQLWLHSGVASRAGRWIAMPAAPPPGERATEDSGGTPAAGPAGARSAADHLQRLDSVVHDFVGALDQGVLGSIDGGTAAAHAQRFLELLDCSLPNRTQVLGPPILFGASPSIGLETVLGFLSSLRKTGILRVEGEGTFMISIVKGDVVHAVSHPRPEPELLGNVLLARGTVDAERLERFFEEHGSSASRIGEALERQALVSTEELQEAFEHQMQMLFHRLFSTTKSEWCFHEGEATLAYIKMRMNVISVLLESARMYDEAAVAA